MRTTVSSIVISVVVSCSFAAPVAVDSVTATQRSGYPIIDIHYNLTNPSGGLHTVTVEVSTNSGGDYTLCFTNFTGDIGVNITTGSQKHIVWGPLGDLPGNTVASNTRVRVSATDAKPDSNNMVMVPGCAYVMGNCMPPSEGATTELPLHTVYCSAFLMDRTEVTGAKWAEIYSWATANGYSFENAGAYKSADHPAQLLNWYNCLKWCNARSEKEGLVPCYYTDSMQTNVYRSGQRDLSTGSVKWTANGYRLPTEVEWEKAARGGSTGHRFPWSDSDEIQHTRANYLSTNIYTYDTSLTRGYHPAYTNTPMPYDSPVGSFPANGYGLCDMAGNVFEWCWDWYLTVFYSLPEATLVDTRGPTNGEYRVLRSGGWGSNAYQQRNVYRRFDAPTYAASVYGFRTVRSAPSPMVLVPGGMLTLGDDLVPDDGYADELPAHSLYVSPFYIDTYEVTGSKWTEVYLWATNHGYSFENTGTFKRIGHPVHTLNWYDSIKWCNARSELEGLIPCYYTEAIHTNVYRSGQYDIDAACVIWRTNGYRLPTEAEWGKAARGGAKAHRFPWNDSDSIQHTRANYSSTNLYAYDTSATRGFHPAFSTGGYPYTSPVGYFAPNGYGLYDTAGNVCEWCWDWYSDTFYSSADASVPDTTGPTNGVYRMLSSGDWHDPAYRCRVAFRRYSSPESELYLVGFRCVRPIEAWGAR